MFKEIRYKLENILCSILHNSNNWPQLNGKKPTLELRTVCSCELSHFSYVRLCDSMGCSPPGSSIHGILQARILE